MWRSVDRPALPGAGRASRLGLRLRLRLYPRRSHRRRRRLCLRHLFCPATWLAAQFSCLVRSTRAILVLSAGAQAGKPLCSVPRAARRSCVMRGRQPRRDAPMRTFASRFVFFSLSDRAAACANRDRGEERQLQSNRLQLALSHNERQEGLEARAFRALPLLCAKRLRLLQLIYIPNNVMATQRECKRPVLRGGKDGRWRLLLASTAAAAAGGDGGGGAGRPPPEGIIGQAGSRVGMMPARAPLGLIGGRGGRSSERMTCGMGRSACAHGTAALLAREPGSVQCCAAGRKLQAAARDRASRRLARRRVSVDVSHLRVPISPNLSKVLPQTDY